MNTQNEPKYHHAHNYPFSQDTLMQAIIDLGKQLKESEHQLSVSNEKNKRSVAQISILEDKLKISQENTLYWQECSRSMQEKRKELTAYYEAAESDNERLVDALVVEQDKNKVLENKITELSTKDIKNQPEVKQGVNLTQSEVDFLKSYLSNCITESQENIDLLKDTAKDYKGAVKNSCYKGADKLQKKLKVLSVIQHKLKKTVLSRNEQKYYFSPDEYGMRWWNRALSTEEAKTLTENPWQIFEQQKPKDEFLGFNRKEYENTWYSVVDALNAVHPNFFQQEGTGEQCAVRAILELGKDSQRLKEIKEMLNKA